LAPTTKITSLPNLSNFGSAALDVMKTTSVKSCVSKPPQAESINLFESGITFGDCVETLIRGVGGGGRKSTAKEDHSFSLADHCRRRRVKAAKAAAAAAAAKSLSCV
jgi:hypothetical protein